jgi:flavin-binding protein dodecin
MSVARVTEIKAATSVSFDDAIKEGITRARQTLRNIKSAWIENQEVLIDEDGRITEYRVQMRLTFVLDD